MATPESLAEAFPREQARVRDLIGVYRTIPTGGFGAAMLEDVLRRADEAAVSGDVVAMLRSYQEMQECK